MTPGRRASTQIALLRGINVGSRRRVAMGDLRELLSAAGYGGVQTHLQSGNVLLTSPVTGGALSSELQRQISARFGFDIAVVVRTRDELAKVVAHDPFGEVVTDAKRYQVSFLSDEPEAAAIERLAATDHTPERFAHHGREIYAWHPDGIHRSPLARLISDQQLGVTVTARNWNTVLKLLAMADE